MNKRPTFAIKPMAALCIAVTLALSGCASTGGAAAVRSTQSVDHSIEEGLAALASGRADRASVSFNAALRLEPTNSYYQFLNALAYHVMVEQGDPTKAELARVGYELAIDFDSSNWMAAQQLGRLLMRDGDYQGSLGRFGDAARSNPEDPWLWYDLARAAYFAEEFDIAAQAIARSASLQPESAEVMGASSIINAAAGDPASARQYLARFTELERSEQRVSRLAGRVAQWERAVAFTPDEPQHGTTAGGGEAHPPPAGEPGQMAQPAQPVPTAPPDQRHHWGNPAELRDHERMVMVDVMILRSEDVEVTNKGVNLLDGLVAQFSLNLDDRRTRGASGRYTGEQTIARKLGLSEVRYNLNIFNAGNNRNEVLARPSLVVTDGETSEFFSGQTLNAAVQGRDSGRLEKIDAGVSMKVKPTFRPDGFIKLDIQASRSFFEFGPNGTFNESIRTSKNNITASVLLRFNQTLILGGLREKEDAEVKDGVPLLRDLPIVQYVFSNEITQDYSESLIILVTPRPLIQGVTTDHQHPGEVHDFAAEFQRDYGALFDSTPNIGYAAKDLSKHRAYRELYETDIFERPWWGSREDIERVLGRAKSYLYY